MGVKRFEDLIAWQRAVDLAISMYELTEGKSARYSRLIEQMTSAAVSIPSNIPEGFERNMMKDLCRFLGIAKGSSGELMTQLHIAGRVGCLDAEVAGRAITQTREVSRLVGSLRRAIEKRAEPRTRH